MSSHHYSLQRYGGVSSRHTCPGCGGRRCFSLYVDEDGNALAENVGRCDHESSCGYHYTPRDYFRDHPERRDKQDWREVSPLSKIRKPYTEKKESELCVIPDEYVRRSVRADRDSHLGAYLKRMLPAEAVDEVFRLYRVGVTRSGDVIYFQIDGHGRCRSGKIMKYDPDTGHRVKDAEVPGRVGWVHSILKARGVLSSDWQLTQCLFGEHLLKEYPEKNVALVEAEKTAVICAALMPQYLWIASGGKTQLGDKLKVLLGRKAVAFPDADGLEEWTRRLCGSGIKVSDFLERTATDEEKSRGADLADVLLREICEGRNMAESGNAADRKGAGSGYDPILKYFSKEVRGEVQALIDELDLFPVSVGGIGKDSQHFTDNKTDYP